MFSHQPNKERDEGMRSGCVGFKIKYEESCGGSKGILKGTIVQIQCFNTANILTKGRRVPK